MIPLLLITSLYSAPTLNADIVSRYVWRGKDFGNAAAIQPTIELQLGPINVGAWGSWSLSPGPNDASGNECDLYASTTIKGISFTITDYFFPSYLGEDEFLNMDKHLLEVSLSHSFSKIDFSTSMNFYGDDQSSTYLELANEFVGLGVGNGTYTSTGKFSVVSFSITAQRDFFSTTYIINPDLNTSFIVFGINI